ncbi:MAG: winged helix-turn-helix transcriptional regulator [Deltaproteobacteria bacterium]|nr:winged helix-turn-helix transcriptional regulator [Deltaproteobacteria bacterium]
MHVLMSDEAEALAQLFRALSDPNRLRLLSALEDGERCVHELVKAMEMTQPAVSQQLRLLRDLGVVRGRRQGRHVYYSLQDEHVRAVYATALSHVRHVPAGRRAKR